MRLFVYLLVNVTSILVASKVLPGIKVDDLSSAIILAIVLGVINTFLKPLLVILTLPINILTLGLFVFVINGLLVVLAGNIVPGFHVDGFFWAILFSLVISLVSSFLNKLVN